MVRLSALKTIETLTCPQSLSSPPNHTNNNGSVPSSDQPQPEWMKKVIEPLFIHTFQRSLLETDLEALELVTKVS